MSNSNPAAGPSQRQLRVGELVRHALTDFLSRGAMSDPQLDGVIITISEVRMTPDLRHANVLATALAKPDSETIIAALNRQARYVRGKIAPALRQLRNIPDLRFQLDTRFDDDSRINELLRSQSIASDLDQNDPSSPDDT